jgi:hypothetical protein
MVLATTLAITTASSISVGLPTCGDSSCRCPRLAGSRLDPSWRIGPLGAHSARATPAIDHPGESFRTKGRRAEVRRS